ncbi:hypothetical protein L6452_08256 [Arctium lappa]|uniref:Uncharacterized protein n=1 Tax=Arctium lappa TaxID=4217 RepID=A0ACB9DH47_ARCLA|nr:hypothetical protein L6452_08256 [Arctium lappa]
MTNGWLDQNIITSSLGIYMMKRSFFGTDLMMISEKTVETYKIKDLIDTAIAKYNHDIGSSQANTLVTWRLNKCNQQQDG